MSEMLVLTRRCQRKPIIHPEHKNHPVNLDHLRGSLHESGTVPMVVNKKKSRLKSSSLCAWDGPLVSTRLGVYHTCALYSAGGLELSRYFAAWATYTRRRLVWVTLIVAFVLMTRRSPNTLHSALFTFRAHGATDCPAIVKVVTVISGYCGRKIREI